MDADKHTHATSAFVLIQCMMKRTLYTLAFILMGIAVRAQTVSLDTEQDAAFYQATQQWFNAWELVSRDLYGVKQSHPVEFLFFDDTYLYSTCAVSSKDGQPIKGNDLMGLPLHWKRKEHKDTLTLPDGAKIPVGLMSFAGSMPDGNGAFFVMPLPSFWKQAGVSSKELGLDNLVTGVFIHEFSHSQQMQNFGKWMGICEREHQFDVEFTDDIIQHLFSNDSVYVQHYQQEVASFYASVKDDALDSSVLNKAISLFEQRHKYHLQKVGQHLLSIDELFLTMEGMGQYSMLLWLTHPQGGNLHNTQAIAGVRRGGKWWSQDEGLALFLVLDQLSETKEWAKDMFGTETQSVMQLIRKLMK